MKSTHVQVGYVCPEGCLDFGSHGVALLLLRQPAPMLDCLAYRQRQDPVSSPGKGPAFGFM